MEKVKRLSRMICLLAMGSCVSNPMAEEARNPAKAMPTFFWTLL